MDAMDSARVHAPPILLQLSILIISYHFLLNSSYHSINYTYFSWLRAAVSAPSKYTSISNLCVLCPLWGDTVCKPNSHFNPIHRVKLCVQTQLLFVDTCILISMEYNWMIFYVHTWYFILTCHVICMHAFIKFYFLPAKMLNQLSCLTLHQCWHEVTINWTLTEH